MHLIIIINNYTRFYDLSFIHLLFCPSTICKIGITNNIKSNNYFKCSCFILRTHSYDQRGWIDREYVLSRSDFNVYSQKYCKTRDKVDYDGNTITVLCFNLQWNWRKGSDLAGEKVLRVVEFPCDISALWLFLSYWHEICLFWQIELSI